jgi:hypothetical protein
VTRYAQGTTVTVASSRGEITGILAKHGVERMGWQTGPDGDELLFQLSGQSFRFQILKPTAKSLWEQWKADGKSETSLKYLPSADQVEAEWRRRWRANVLLLKAKLEFIASGDTTLERELLPYMITASGQTVADLVVAGKLPMLAARAGS